MYVCVYIPHEYTRSLEKSRQCSHRKNGLRDIDVTGSQGGWTAVC